VTGEESYAYATVGGTTLGMDLHRAPQAGAPLVLYVHGGGWRSGNRADAGATRLAPLAARGVTVASVDYRLVPDATFPDQLHDLKGAVRWLRAHGPRLGVPTDRLGVWGASAGAYLGSLLALTGGDGEFEGAVGGNLEQASGVQAVVHWFGQSDLLVSGSRSDIEARLLPFAFELVCSVWTPWPTPPIVLVSSACSPTSRPRRHPSSSRTATATTSSHRPRGRPCTTR
jgi:hypothetical protein